MRRLKAANLNPDPITMNKHLLTLFSTLLLVAFCTVPLQADSASEASARIKDRLAQVDTMKASGEVGEDARGYLAVRQSLGPRKQALVDAENADRKILYAEVAGRTGRTVDEVGRQRAIRIAELATTGVWLQKPDGEWYRK